MGKSAKQEYKREVEIDIQEAQNKVQPRKRNNVHGVSFGGVKEGVLFQIPGPSYVGKVFVKATSSWAREVIKKSKLGIEKKGDWIPMFSYEEVFPIPSEEETKPVSLVEKTTQ